MTERARPRALQGDFAPSLRPTSRPATNWPPFTPLEPLPWPLPSCVSAAETAALRERARPRAQQRDFAPSLHPTPRSATNWPPFTPLEPLPWPLPSCVLRPGRPRSGSAPVLGRSRVNLHPASAQHHAPQRNGHLHAALTTTAAATLVRFCGRGRPRSGSAPVPGRSSVNLHPASTQHHAPQRNGLPSRRSNYYRGRFPRTLLRPRRAHSGSAPVLGRCRVNLHPASAQHHAPQRNGLPSRRSNHYHGRFARTLLRPRRAHSRRWSRNSAQRGSIRHTLFQGILPSRTASPQKPVTPATSKPQPVISGSNANQ